MWSWLWKGVLLKEFGAACHSPGLTSGSQVSNMIVMFLRLVTSCEVQRREDFFFPFILVSQSFLPCQVAVGAGHVGSSQPANRSARCACACLRKAQGERVTCVRCVYVCPKSLPVPK